MRRLHALLAALTAVFVVVVGLPAAGGPDLGLGLGASPASAASSASSVADDAVTLELAPAESGVLVPGRDLVLDVVSGDSQPASLARVTKAVRSR
jgi:hypothetical protein